MLVQKTKLFILAILLSISVGLVGSALSKSITVGSADSKTRFDWSC